MNDLEKLAHGFMRIKERYEELLKEANRLSEENEEYRRRDRAEEILMMAQDKNCSLKTASVEDFITQRQKLEQQSFDELEKIASAIEYIDEDGAIFVSEMKDGHARTDFTGWLNTISEEL